MSTPSIARAPSSAIRCLCQANAVGPAAHATLRRGRRHFSSSSSKSSDDAQPQDRAAVKPPTAQTVSEHILNTVRASDYPSSLCTSFYPDADARFDYLALRAFNCELSSIADSVTNAQLGRVRFQWWREAIASIASNKPLPHPTVLALHVAFRRRKLSSYHLNRIIDAKERNLLSPTCNTLSDLTSYAQSTSLPLLSMQLQILTPRSTSKIADIPLSTIDHSLSHLATYMTIAQLLRSVYYFAASKRAMVIPRDVASSHGIVDENVFRALPSLQGKKSAFGPPPAEAFATVVEASSELVALAENERAKSRWTLGLEESGDDEHRELAQGRQLSSLPKELRPLFLSAIPAKSYLRQLVGTANYNPFHPMNAQQQSRNWRLPLEILYANWKGQY